MKESHHIDAHSISDTKLNNFGQRLKRTLVVNNYDNNNNIQNYIYENALVSRKDNVISNNNDLFNNVNLHGGDTSNNDCDDDNSNENCTVVFENAGDDGVNLMEEEKEEEEETFHTVKNEDKIKTKTKSEENGSATGVAGKAKKFKKLKKLVVEDEHIGAENSQQNRQSKNEEENGSTPSNINEIASIDKKKAKEVTLMPQSSVVEGTKSQVSNLSDTAKYPSLPLPHMLPLPLFYNSGEREGSAENTLTGVSKNTDKEIENFNGESGYGESSLPVPPKTVLLTTVGEKTSGNDISTKNAL